MPLAGQPIWLTLPKIADSMQQFVRPLCHDVNRNCTIADAPRSKDEPPWLDKRVPNGFWDYRSNRLRYLKWLGCRCGFCKAEDWYALRRHHFQKNCGGGLLRNVYQCSVQNAMAKFLPEYDWKPWLFGGTPNGYWKDRGHRMNYLGWLGQQLGIQRTADWYNVTSADSFHHHGGGLLNNEFNGCVQSVLSDCLPGYRWRAWLFNSVPQSFWKHIGNRQEYVFWLGKRLGFRKLDDWSRLTREHFFRNGGAGLFVGYYKGSTQQAIAELRPGLRDLRAPNV
jgi:hypothetical protein